MTNSSSIAILGLGLLVVLPPGASGQALEAERRAWEATEPRSYQFEYRMDCFCWGAGVWWRIVVRGDSVTGIFVVDSMGARSGLDRVRADEHPTIRRLFGDIAAAAVGQRALVEVKYDEHWHYPVVVKLSRDTTWFDAGYSLEIRNFMPLP